MTTKIEEKVELVRELRGTTCRCGAQKKPMDTFCGFCYHRLPLQMKKDLYRPLSGGYVEAYQAAVKRLEYLSMATPEENARLGRTSAE